MGGHNRVFVAAWAYPPIMSGESVVCRTTLKHSSHNYDVCCGPAENDYGDEHIQLFHISGEKYLRWPFAAARLFERLNAQESYKVMMSRVMPPNGHLAGWLIKKKHPEIKWIAYFSDPVWNSPFLKFSFRNDGSHRPNWLLYKLLGLPSKWAVKKADVLVFNNERLARYVTGTEYESVKDKVLIAPYGHEGVKLRPAQERGDGKLLITHVGQIYGDRTLKALIGGMELLKAREPKLYKRISIRQVGYICEAERRRIQESPAAEAFTLIDQVPYAQSIEEMYKADILLVIDPVFDDKSKNIYVPAKIYDYMSTGRPILCIADEDSATGDVAKRIKCTIAQSDEETVYCTLTAISNGGFAKADTDGYCCFLYKSGVDCLDHEINKCGG